MANPIVTVPAAPLAIDATINSAAENFLSSLLQVFEHGTTGLSAPTDETDATYRPEDDHGHVGPMLLRSREQQLFFRQLGIAIAVRFPAGGGGVGPPGPQGPDGPPGLNWLGVYSGATSYLVDDAVEFEGSSWVCVAPSLGVTPAIPGTFTPNTGWNLLAKKGVYVPPTPDFTCGLSGGGQLEVGQMLVNPSFNASYNRSPTTATLQDNQGNPSQNVLGVANPIVVARSYQKNTADQSVSFTLSATEPQNPASAAATWVWRQKAFWGIGPTGQRSSAFIQALANSVLTSSKNRSFTVDAGSTDQHIYYAYRAAYGTSTFWVGGFEGGFDGPYTVSVTNPYGVTENFYLYQSVQPGLGSTTVTVQ